MGFHIIVKAVSLPWVKSVGTDHNKDYLGVCIIGLDVLHVILYHDLLNPVALGIPIVKKNCHKSILFHTCNKQVQALRDMIRAIV